MPIELTINAADYIASRGWEAKAQGNQLAVKVCPLCGKDKFHFYINRDSGLWDCKVCSQDGNLVTLLRHMGDLEKYLPERKGSKKAGTAFLDAKIVEGYHAALLGSEAGMSFLRNRGFTLDTIKKYKLGFREYPGIGPVAGYPVFAGGGCVFIKWRTITGQKTFRREPEGTISPLFLQDAIMEKEPVFLCEGEADALAAIQAGFRAAGTTTGAGGFAPEWIPRLKRASRVYLLYDPDAAGKSGAEKIATAIGKAKCYNVALPEGMDVNDFLNLRGKDELQRLIDAAAPYGKPLCETAEDVYEKHLIRRQTGEKDSILTGVSFWDDFIGPLRRGNLDVLMGYQGTGKTSLALLLAWSLARRGRRVWYVCLELSDEEVMDVLCSHISGKAIDDLADADRATGYATIQATGFRFFDSGNLFTWKELLETLHTAVRENAIDVLFVDNFHYLTRVERNSTEVEGCASKTLKGIASECRIPVIVLHHPLKPSLEEREPEVYDSRGSSSLLNDASSVIILHRPLIRQDGEQTSDRYEAGTLKRGKARWGRGGRIHIRFDGAKRNFEQITFDEYKRIVPQASGSRKPVRRLPGNIGMDYAGGNCG